MTTLSTHCTQYKEDQSLSIIQNTLPKNKLTLRRKQGPPVQPSEEHYKITIGEIINNTYEVTCHLGDGTFGRVLGCRSILDNKLYALKVIKAIEKYILTGQFEADVLVKLQKAGAPHMVRLTEQFRWGANYVIVFEQLGVSLFELQRLHPKCPGLSVGMLKAVTRQVLT